VGGGGMEFAGGGWLGGGWRWGGMVEGEQMTDEGEGEMGGEG
jgi:hypothetical protein